MDVGVGRFVETCPDYIGIINNQNENLIENLNPIFNSSKYVTSNVFISIRYNKTDCFNYTVSYNYIYFGYFQAYVYSLFGGNLVSLIKKDVLIQNIDKYPFTGILILNYFQNHIDYFYNDALNFYRKKIK